MTEDERAAAREAVHAALEGAGETVRSVRVTLSVIDDPSLPRPALAQAIVEVGGGRRRAPAPARARAAAID
ncbi:MAG: hypothetical protein IRY90_12350, partial [Actinomadura rubrobrunea]|nr:hypothetical protein [Actinomadura rubrobrunea]